MAYKKLGVIKFGKALIATGDLDPVYIALWETLDPSNPVLKRTLLAYWWFYHLGVAAKLSTYGGKDFFDEALRLAKSKAKTPRGTERRYFRGDAALQCIKYFKREYKSPEEAVEHLIAAALHHDCTVKSVISFVQKKWPQFGPWIGFKVADMLERLDLANIAFPIETLKMYREPVKGAILVSQTKGWDTDVIGVVKNLIPIFEKYDAPPQYERPCGVQEVETILCKWKSHINENYPPRKDTFEIYHGLEGWGLRAEQLRKVMEEQLSI